MITKLLDEIEQLQKQVEEILHHKNWIIRTLKWRKMLKLNKQAEEKIKELYRLL